MRKTFFFILAIPLIYSACSSLRIEPVNFAWPIETVLKVDRKGNVNEEKYSVEFNTRPLFYEEYKDSNAYNGKEIRMIRDQQGFYYITAKEFKNVYVFSANDGELILHNKISISETGIKNPAFNQRTSYIELIDGNKRKLNLTHKKVNQKS